MAENNGKAGSWYPRGDSTRAQHQAIAAALIRLGHTDRRARMAELSRTAGRPVPAFAALSHAEAGRIIVKLAVRLGARQRQDAG